AVCMAVWLLGRGSFYRIREFEHVEDAVAFFRGFSEAALHSTTHRDMFMCVVKFSVLQLRNTAAKGHNAEIKGANDPLRSRRNEEFGRYGWLSLLKNGQHAMLWSSEWTARAAQ